MQFPTYYPNRSRSRKRLLILISAVILGTATGFMAGLTIQAIEGEAMRSFYQGQIADMQAEIDYLESRPAGDNHV